MTPEFYIDIMKPDGSFICQIPYYGKAEQVDNKKIYDYDDVERTIYEHRPSLRNKSFRIYFSENKSK